MSEYRFIAFPSGVVPTAKEVAAFRGYADQLNDRVAYGKQRDGAGLAICCQAEPFDRLRGLDPKFHGLLKGWEKQGAEVVASLPFTRDKQAWREIRPKKDKEKKAEAKPSPGTPAQPAGRTLAAREQAPRRPEAGRVSQPSGKKAWLLYGVVAIVAAIGFSVVGYFMGRQSQVDQRVLEYLDRYEQILAEEQEKAAAPEGDRGDRDSEASGESLSEAEATAGER